MTAPNAALGPPIGKDGLPVRAIAFSSGAFDTAMQLGVVHALLTIQGKAPDVVVGVSAGAINAAALAEILQAGIEPSQHPVHGKVEAKWPALALERQKARIARFREIYEEYLSAPRGLGQAFVPDTLQVDASKPLKPLELPIHEQLERRGRAKEVHARQGLINLFNELLSVRLSFAAITRFVRGGLGLKASGEVRSSPTRWLAMGFEILRAWSLLGVNLIGAAWLTRPLLRPLVSSGTKQTRGSTAAGIIYARSWVRVVRSALRHMFSVALLFLFWVTVTVTVLGFPFVLVGLVIRAHLGVGAVLGWLGWNAPAAVAAQLAPHGLRAALVIYGLLAAGFFAGAVFSGAWKKVARYTQGTAFTTLRDLSWELFRLVPPLALLIALPVGVAAVAMATATSHDHTWMQEIAEAIAGAIRLYWWTLLPLVVAVFLLARKQEHSYVRRLLSRYDLADGLLGTHPLRQFFIRLFDPGYYGDRKMDDVVDRALRDDLEPSRQPPGEKLIEHYESQQNSPPIAVGLMVANLSALREPPKEGSLDIVEVVPRETKLVDGLLAATAVSPLFPPVQIGRRLFMDGANVSFEATRGLLHLLRGRVNPKSTTVQLYSVGALPFSRSSVPAQRSAEFPEGKPALNLVDVALRAFQLMRFRDATLERRLTELFTRAIPPGSAVYSMGQDKFLRIWVTPIEPDEPLSLGERLLRCEGLEEGRTMIAETVADGCRAALEVMIRGSMAGNPNTAISCLGAVQAHRAKQMASQSLSLPLLPLLSDGQPRPDDAADSPGLPEVCRHCRLSPLAPVKPPAGAPPITRSLVIRDWEKIGAVWPHEYQKETRRTPGKLTEDPHFVRRTPPAPQPTPEQEAKKWPLARVLPDQGMVAGDQRPVVSLLFSGGVFRGVYQVGTLNALSDAGLYPDIIAGASIGSITAAMVAQTFSGAPGATHAARMPAIARVAATYLAIDRLVLTDRFADFVRGLTLRAAATRFSLRQADRFFRRFDAAGANQFNREARLVAAGLERLFWLSPFELHDLVKALRLGKANKVYDQLRSHVQEWLERMGVGNQVLGSEPLALLISEHVLERLTTVGGAPAAFDHFLDTAGICFLATTVNLTEGCLEILGEGQLGGTQPPAVMLEGLLASSAFPGVFRPRWSWEVMPRTNARHQYIDGGTMDNLPLDAVAHFIKRVSDQGRIPDRPHLKELGNVPHLLFSASLQVNPDVPSKRELDRYPGEWPLLLKRAGQLRYNKKLEQYAEAQRHLRRIHGKIRREGTQQPGLLVPLDLEVVMVRPRWLCGTFGFHPMLGFRRQRQVESIAHGCATALMELGRVSQQRPKWVKGWGVDMARLPTDPPRTDSTPILPRWARESDPGQREALERKERAEKERTGECWYRPGVPCTFSRATLTALKAGIPTDTIEELAEIHRACGRPETHQPRG
jgi:predicted acylesterase/phospholipase RssA